MPPIAAARSRKILLLLAVAALTALAIHALLPAHARAQISPVDTANSSIPVRSALATRDDIDLALHLVARTEAWSTVTIQARCSGQLQALDFKPGAMVAKGDVLAHIDPLPFKAQLDQAAAEAASSKAEWIKAQADLARYRQILAQGYLSRASFDSYQAKLDVAYADLQTHLAAQQIAQLQLGYTTIRAPFTGVTGLPLSWPGAQLTANSTDIVVLNQIDPLRVSFSVPESSLATIRQAQQRGPVLVQVTRPDEPGPPLTGVLEFVDNSVDVSTSTMLMKATLANHDGRLSAGQFMRVQVPTAHLQQVVSIPAPALQDSDQGNFVFVVGVDAKAHQRFVQIGPSVAGRVVIQHGLAAGERVVTDGQLQLSEGVAVRTVSGS